MRSSSKFSLLHSLVCISSAIHLAQAGYGKYACGTNEGSYSEDTPVNLPSQFHLSTSSRRLPDVYYDSQIRTSVDIGLCLAQAPNACPRGTGDSVVVFRVRLVLYSCYDNRIPAREN